MPKELKLQFDFSHGPIWKDVYNPKAKEWSTGIDVIDKDSELNALNDEMTRMYSSFYIFDDYGVPHFDAEAFEKNRSLLLSKISTVINRINAINDGSFVINDLASKELGA